MFYTNKGEAAGAPIGLEQVFATAQTKECSFPVETPAGLMLVAMAEQPVLVTPGTMQQNLLNLHNQIV